MASLQYSGAVTTEIMQASTYTCTYMGYLLWDTHHWFILPAHNFSYNTNITFSTCKEYAMIVIDMHIYNDLHAHMYNVNTIQPKTLVV